MVGTINVVSNWLLLSSLYAIVAIGFTMIFGIGNVLNLFHGASLTLGAYFANVAYVAGYPIWMVVLAGFLIPGIVNGVLYLGLVRYIMDRPVTVMVLTLILALVVEEIILVFIGATPRVVPAIIAGHTAIGSLSVQTNRVLVFVLSWVVMGALLWFVNYTKTGQAILATSMSKKGSAIVGIDSDRMLLYTWIVAGVLAGVAGVFLASFQTASYNMGVDPLVLSFAIVVLGGMGSIKGSIVGAYVIGGLETAMTSFIDPRLNGLASLVVLVVILMIQPEGLYGRKLIMEAD